MAESCKSSTTDVVSKDSDAEPTFFVETLQKLKQAKVWCRGCEVALAQCSEKCVALKQAADCHSTTSTCTSALPRFSFLWAKASAPQPHTGGWTCVKVPLAEVGTAQSADAKQSTERSLLSGCALLCRFCDGAVVRSEAVEQWFALPSDYWAELSDLWFCCSAHHSSFDASELRPRRGAGLFSRRRLLVHFKDLRDGFEDFADSHCAEHCHCRTLRLLRCPRCGAEVGHLDADGSVAELWKFQLKAGHCAAKWLTQFTVSGFIHSKIVEASGGRMIYHFVIEDHCAAVRTQLTVVTLDALLCAGHWLRAAQWQNAVCVTFEEVSDDAKHSQWLGTLKAKGRAVLSVRLPTEACLRFNTQLKQLCRKLPPHFAQMNLSFVLA